MKHNLKRTLLSLKSLAIGIAALTAAEGALTELGSPVFSSGTAEAIVRAGGGARAGGYRAASRTTVRPGVGVTHSTTVAAGRYHRPATLPGHAYVPGSAVGVAHRTARRTTRRVAYRTAGGYSYYYGAPVVVLPTPACYSVMWEGMAAYNCNGVIYLYEGGQYYPMEQ